MKRFVRQLSKFLNLPAREKFLLMAAFFLVVLFRIGIWVLPFRQMKKILSKIAARAPVRNEGESPVIKQIVRFVGSVSRFVPSASCLTQALAALVLIKFYGEHAELKFGITIDSNKNFAAHAWLERSGRIILGKLSDHGNYTILKPTKYSMF
jgi:hypothetical protein